MPATWGWKALSPNAGTDLIDQDDRRAEQYESRCFTMVLSTLTCPTFLNILHEFGAADRTPVSLDSGFGLGGVQDRHWCTL
jgi:hypothetical protein